MNSPARQKTEVLIHKPTIIDGDWQEVPAIVRIEGGKIVEERLPLREQLREAAKHLAVMVLAFPAFFMLADWLRYGG